LVSRTGNKGKHEYNEMQSNVKGHLKLYILTLLLFCSAKGIGQKHTDHFFYIPKSYVVLDTFTINDTEYDMNEVILSVAEYDSISVFVTSKYFASIAYNPHRIIHTTYNRKTRIIRYHIKYPDKDFFAEDSVMYYLHHDKELRKNANRIKDTLDIREDHEVQKTIHGKKCHLITHPVYEFFSNQLDSIWVADIKETPTLFSTGFYFLMQGVPFEYVVNDGLVSVQVSSVKRPAPGNVNMIFTIDPGLSELHQMQSQNRIANVTDFISAFKANLN